ncbi:MAG: M56 family metallopeptidase [Roseibium sp.]|uniref:M56 family metallopeptidase n=1 Tax=Roseibium sp. TaxID=1936156 RepID=UPI002610D3C9|nr:M56 family metallopeptidase [Roseibium sp.]MCV0423932.1 M56 family metallopeptidase [Roseibium sp.]
MIALAYFIEANLALLVSVLVMAMLRLLATTVAPVSARTDVLVLRGILTLSCTIPLLALVYENVSGTDAVLLGVTAEFDTFWGTLLYWLKDAQRPDVFFSALMFGSATTGMFALGLDLMGLRRLKSGSRVIRRIGRTVLREGRPGVHPCSFLEMRTVSILVPEGISISDRRTILFHEVTHIRHRDVRWNWIFSLSACLYAWNPAFWILRNFHQHQCEVACDQRVISHRPVSLQDYVKTLLDVAGVSSGTSEPVSAGSGFLGGKYLQKTALKRRILCLLSSYEKGSDRSLLPVFLTLALLTNVFLATLKVDIQPWSVAALASATNSNLERIALNKPARSFGLVLAY